MELRNVGRSGLRVSVIGLGCNNFGGRIGLEASRRVVDRAIDRGITLFDTADIYGEGGGSETALGEILGARRQDIVLATKFGMVMGGDERKKGGSRRYVMQAVEDSLRRLKTDWIDLYYLHRPDPLTPIAETLHALDDLIRQGKVRYAGCSNFAPWQVVEAEWTARSLGLHGFICAQDEYSLLVREPDRELVPALQAHGLGLVPYFPLASGFLTGKYKRGAPLPEGTRLAGAARYSDRWLTEHNWAVLEALEAFCAARGRTLVELAFGWLLARPGVPSVIAGATRPEQIDQNVDAAGWTLTAEELAEIDRLTGSPDRES